MATMSAEHTKQKESSFEEKIQVINVSVGQNIWYQKDSSAVYKKTRFTKPMKAMETNVENACVTADLADIDEVS